MTEPAIESGDAKTSSGPPASDGAPAADGKPAYRRRIFLIYPRFQATLMAINFIIITLAFALVLIQVNRLFNSLAGLGGSGGSLDSTILSPFIDLQSRGLYLQILIAYSFSVIWSSLITLLLSHRIAGPMVRLRNYFTDLPGGPRPLRKLTFRENDFFQELPPIINSALDVLQNEKR